MFGDRRAFHLDPREEDEITWNTTFEPRIATLRDVRGAGYPLAVAQANGVATDGITVNGRRAYSNAVGAYLASFTDWATEPAGDWLYGVVVDLTGHGWIFDMAAGRLLIGTDQYYTDSDGFIATGGVGPRLGVQVITAEFRAGVGTIRSHKAVDTTIVCAGAYTQKGISSASPRALMATYIQTGPAAAKYGECALIRAPEAGDAATLGALLRSSYGIT